MMRIVGMIVGCVLSLSSAWAQTAGKARMEVSLLDYNGSGTKHYTVVWVTAESGAFIKTLRKQGPSSWTSKEWNDHCRTWNTARAGSTVLDGYTGATASNYSGTNSPVVCAWDGRDAAGRVVLDGAYRFWVQYAENSGQGPFTTRGLSWTKGPEASTNTFPDQSPNFSAMKVIWKPDAPPAVAPVITSIPLTPQATVGVPYAFTCSAEGTAPIRFAATGLPVGLNISLAGAISGTPLAAGTFKGNIVAANGTTPDAQQPFAITVAEYPVSIQSVRREAQNLVSEASGPPYGSVVVLSTSDLPAAESHWTPEATGRFDAAGRFSYTNVIDAGATRRFYWLRVP